MSARARVVLALLATAAGAAAAARGSGAVASLAAGALLGVLLDFLVHAVLLHQEP